MMYGELVERTGLLTGMKFLAGYGLVQGLPGTHVLLCQFCRGPGGPFSRGLDGLSGSLSGPRSGYRGPGNLFTGLSC
jgi:hypothetical protein